MAKVLKFGIKVTRVESIGFEVTSFTLVSLKSEIFSLPETIIFERHLSLLLETALSGYRR